MVCVVWARCINERRRPADDGQKEKRKMIKGGGH